jgi:hypothetical protein
MEDFLQLHLGLLAGTGPSHTSDASDQEKKEEKMVEFRHHDHPSKKFFILFISNTILKNKCLLQPLSAT